MSKLNDSLLEAKLDEALKFLKYAHIEEYITYDKEEEIESLFESCRKNITDKDRRIKVAIAGKMNTGKSMLIDNLFFKGQGIVSSFEIPSTARLSTLFYSEREYAIVTFITQDDLQRLEKLAPKYEQDNDETYKAAAELFSAIRKSDVNYVDILGKKQEIHFNSLREYSDAQGKYTIFVKTIDIHINQSILKDIEIIDTPGLGDPIISREQITNDKMNDVDLVIYLSYAGMFMDDNDINYYLFLKRKGIDNVIIVASRFDEILNAKDFNDNDPRNSQAFLAIYSDFAERFKAYLDSERYQPVHVLPSMPLIAKLYYLIGRAENLDEISAFYKNKITKKLQIDFSTDPVLMISGIESINQQLLIIADSKVNQLFISNQNSVLHCVGMILNIYEKTLRDFELKQTEFEILLEDPNLFERIKNEIKYFIVEFTNAILDAKNYAILNLIKPRCQAFKDTYKSHIRSLKTEIGEYFDWLHNNEKEAGAVSRNIRNACDIFGTSISDMFDYSLSSIFEIDENGKLYFGMLDDLKKRLDNIKINGLDTNLKDLESINRLIAMLKTTIYSNYNDELNKHMGAKIMTILSREYITEQRQNCLQDVSNCADNIEKESGWRKGVREERRNNNSRVKSEINRIIDNLETEVVLAIDRLGNTGSNECLDQIMTVLKSNVAAYDSQFYSMYAGLETGSIHEKLDKINKKISQISNCIDEIENIRQKIKMLKPDP